jgi:hypothetical protein
MRRTTVYLDPELEVLLKLEMRRQKRPMAELVREAVAQYLAHGPAAAPPGAGAFASGRTDTAEHVDEALAALGFGRDQPVPPAASSGHAGRRRRRAPRAPAGRPRRR